MKTCLEIVQRTAALSIVGRKDIPHKQKTDHNHFKNCLTNCCDLKLLTVGCFSHNAFPPSVFFHMIGSSKTLDGGGRGLSGTGAAGEKQRFYFGL